MIRLAFRVIIACLIVTAIVGCGAFQFAVPVGTDFARAPGPPLPPSSELSGGFPVIGSMGFPNFIFPGILSGGFGGGATTTGGDTGTPTTGGTTTTGNTSSQS